MSKIAKTIAAVALCLPLVSSATLSAGDMVSVNFWGQFNGADVGRVTGSFGVVGDGNTVNSAWQNIINPSAFTGTLTSKDGVDTTLSISGVRPQGAGRDTGGTAYSQTAMRAFMNTGGANLSLNNAANGGAGLEAHVTVSGLNANFASGYDVYAFIGGQNENTGASLSLTEGSAADWNDDFTNDELNGERTTTRWYKTRWSPGGYTAPVKMTDTTSSVGANTTVADYFRFENHDADSFTITVKALAGSPGNTGIGGIQIVAIPEPATIGLLGLVGGGIYLKRRFMK